MVVRSLEPRTSKYLVVNSRDYQGNLLVNYIKNIKVMIFWRRENHCKIKETLLIQELELAFNVNVGSEKLML